MKMYRPKNWKNPYKDKHEPHSDSWERLCYERGVDAMLEALKTDGITMQNYNPTNRTVVETASFLNQCKDGVLVFIPNEVEQ